MKTILVLTSRFPYPVIGGDRLRIYEVCKELSKKYSLTLASLCENEAEMNMPLPSDGIFNEVHRVHLPRSHSIFNCVLGLPQKTPLQVCYYKSKAFKSLIDQIAPKHDLLLPHLVRMADYVKDIQMPKVIEMTDAISMNYERVISTENSAGIKGLIYKIEFNRLNKYETEIAACFDNTFFVSQFDKEYLYKNNERHFDKAIVASNGVDLDKFPFEFNPQGRDIIFIGNLFSAQNFDAAHWFAEKVMPKLLEYGAFKFKVIGRITEAKQRKLESHRGVYCTGSVDNVADSARGAIAGVCSVRLAAGVQNKILEYMALGIPTITSSIGLEGLDAKPTIDLLVANNEDEYVKYILYLDQNRALSEKIALSGRKYVLDYHSWQSKLLPIVKQVNELIGK
nr:glycosyltransferase family 4 protein [Pseudoalteromonas sp. TB13]|tara:strand:- start:401 stop:1585 length:1185 start_codon:yes stop_codon:yes gene_type:complete